MTRMKSMKVDENDLTQFNYGRYKNMGACVASEYYQYNPFLFTREMAPVNLIGNYRGGSAFLIAGGPSFGNVRQKFLRRPGIWTMTINNAVKSFRGNAAIVVDDPSRFTYSMWIDPKIQKFVPTSHFEKPLWDNRLVTDPSGNQVQLWQPTNIKVGDCPNVIGYRRNEKFVAARFLYEDTINWGNHENLCLCGKGQRNQRGDTCPACGQKNKFGGRSVMLAAIRILFLTGFRNVYLLGVDFEMNDDKKYHFNEGRTPGAIRGNNSTYEKLVKWFEELKPYFLAENFKIVNCNPESKLKVFPFMDYREAVDKISKAVGDTDNERTEGLYSKHEEKMAEYQKGIQSGKPVLMPQNVNQIATPGPVVLKHPPAPRTPPAKTAPQAPQITFQNNPAVVPPEEVKIAEGIPVDLEDEEDHDEGTKPTETIVVEG